MPEETKREFKTIKDMEQFPVDIAVFCAHNDETAKGGTLMSIHETWDYEPEGGMVHLKCEECGSVVQVYCETDDQKKRLLNQHDGHYLDTGVEKHENKE